jgi:glycosyltransferase involved in cell wall biosynthesis
MSRAEQPLVTVVVPVRNNERFLAAALQSILDGEYEHHETIVVDNESEDRSGDVAQRFPVRYVRQRDQGQAGGRNTGIRLARGELIAFLDSDDEWTPDKLARQVAHLEAHPELDFVLSYMRPFLAAGVPRPPWMPPEWFTDGVRGALPGTLLARRRAFDRVGPFDTGYEITSDTDWLVRAGDAGLRWEVLPDVLLRWRMHGQNASYRRPELKADILRTMRASVVRKRAGTRGGDVA